MNASSSCSGTPYPQEIADLQAELHRRGWLRSVHWRPRVDSTNDWARRWLASLSMPSQLPTLFLADEQTAGRGRAQHRWWSPKGCLMLTFVISAQDLLGRSTDDSLDKAEGISSPPLGLVSGVAVAKAVVKQLSPQAQLIQLKWPNDLYLSGKKCGGILIESVGGNHFLIGIGINVHTDFSQAPLDIMHRATSLHTELMKSTPAKVTSGLKWQLLLDLASELQATLQACKVEPSAWHKEWQHFCLLNGKWVQVRQSNGALREGICHGVAADGHLQIFDADGKEHLIHSGEIAKYCDLKENRASPRDPNTD